MAEKRSSRRWSQRLRVNVWEHGSERPIVGYTENVSAEGVFLSMPNPLKAGARVRLEVLADEQTFMAEGIVAHVRRVPRELQKVKQAGIGVSLLPFECFLREVRPSGTTMTASGIWRMDRASLRTATGDERESPAGDAADVESPMGDAPLDGEIVFDLTYAPMDTRLLRDARTAGCLTIGGLEMLVAQAERQFELWTGQSPPGGLFQTAAEQAQS